MKGISSYTLVRVRNLPSEATHKDVREFLHEIQIEEGAIKFLGNTSEAFVAFADSAGADEALKRNGLTSGDRTVYVSTFSAAAFRMRQQTNVVRKLDFGHSSENSASPSINSSENSASPSIIRKVKRIRPSSLQEIAVQNSSAVFQKIDLQAMVVHGNKATRSPNTMISGKENVNPQENTSSQVKRRIHPTVASEVGPCAEAFFFTSDEMPAYCQKSKRRRLNF